MDDCATPKARFENETPLALEAAFDGGRITSDGGSPGWPRWTPRWVCARP